MLRPCIVSPDILSAYRPFLFTDRDVSELLLLGLEEDGVPCGLLAGSPEGEVFTVHSLYIAPACRRRGGALRLLEVLLAVTEDDPSLKRIRCAWADGPETGGLAPLLTGVGFVPAPVEDGLTAAEFTLNPTEDLGYLLSGMEDN